MRKSFRFVLGVLMLLFTSSFSYAQENAVKRALLIIPQENFQDDEFLLTAQELESDGIDVMVASTTLDEIKGTDGAMARADILLKDVNLAEMDAVVFIGGPGAAQYLNDDLAHKLAQDTLAGNKILAAICLGPEILANAGVLKGKNATVYPTEGDKLKNAGVNYTAKPVEKDGLIITADGPASAKVFGQAISRALQGGRDE